MTVKLDIPARDPMATGCFVRFNDEWLRQQHGKWLERDTHRIGTVLGISRNRAHRSVLWAGNKYPTQVACGLLEEVKS